MFPGVDMNRIHLIMGLTHPVLGPMNLAMYSTAMASSISYAWYCAWVQMLVDSTQALAPRPPK